MCCLVCCLFIILLNPTKQIAVYANLQQSVGCQTMTLALTVTRIPSHEVATFTGPVVLINILYMKYGIGY